MKIGKKFNLLTLKEYFFYIDNHQKYVDFNTLGLYRSIIENEKLTVSDKILVRDYAHKFFRKFFDFLQLKDPVTFMKVSTLGQKLTVADEKQMWNEIRINQENFLREKRIKHRNFGDYSKHNCGYETCNYNGLMIKQGSRLTEKDMHFDSDKNKFSAKLKSERLKKERKKVHRAIKTILADENFNQHKPG